jgi:dihydrofolate reductase
MRKLVVFQQVSMDGYFVERNGDMTWAKNDNDEEFNTFTAENAKEDLPRWESLPVLPTGQVNDL